MSAAEPLAAKGDGFSPRVVLALLLVGVFAAAGFLVLTAYAPDLRIAASGGGTVLSPSATGYAGVKRLLELAGQPTDINRSRTGALHDLGMMVLTPQTPGKLDGLDDRHDRLIVLPKWRTQADPQHPGWVGQAEEMSESEVLAVLPGNLRGGLVLQRRAAGASGPSLLHSPWALWPEQGMALGPVLRFQTLSKGALKPVVQDEHGNEILGMAPGGHVFVLSDPDLLNTRGVADARTAKAALVMLLTMRDDGYPIAFDASLNGAGGHSLLRLAIEPPFLGATLSLLLAAALVGVHGWSRFGAARRPERAVALGKLALAENGASMVRLARREPHMARRYVQLCRQRAAAALGAGDLEGEALDDFLDRWAERVKTPDRITALAAEARRVTGVVEMTVLAQRVRRWRLEMTREPG